MGAKDNLSRALTAWLLSRFAVRNDCQEKYRGLAAERQPVSSQTLLSSDLSDSPEFNVRNACAWLPIVLGGSIDLRNENQETQFRNWLGEHGGTVFKVARAYTLNAEDCQDLVQEILLQVWRSLPQFQGRASAATWSYRVALNTALSWQRIERRRRAGQRPLFEVEEMLVAGADGEATACDREMVERLFAAIRQLPKSDAALVLLFLDDLTYRQMAEVLGISESNVGVKLNRAKKALGELMKEDPHGT